MDTPMLDMKAVRSAACLQNGIAYIPNAVRIMENPGREEWLSWNVVFICQPVLLCRAGHCDPVLGQMFFQGKTADRGRAKTNREEFCRMSGMF